VLHTQLEKLRRCRAGSCCTFRCVFDVLVENRLLGGRPGTARISGFCFAVRSARFFIAPSRSVAISVRISACSGAYFAVISASFDFWGVGQRAVDSEHEARTTTAAAIAATTTAATLRLAPSWRS